jgi:hypothetical protein
MTVGEFKKWLEENKVPDTAVIEVEYGNVNAADVEYYTSDNCLSGKDSVLFS